MKKTILILALTIIASACAQAALVDAKQLRANWDGSTLTKIVSQGQSLGPVTARLQLLDPQTKQPVAAGKFALQSNLVAKNGALWLTGVVTAKGTEDAVADLVLRVEGVSLPLGNGIDDMLLATRLLNKIPLISLRTADGQDRLGLAMPADAPYVCQYQSLPAENAVTMKLPLGFSNQAAPALRMKAPFSIVIMATDPRWHFRSVLAEYYRLFPKQFERVEKRDGGWFFANEVKNIPDPQHYRFFEGQGSLDETPDKGLGMFPYNETGSETIQLPGPGLPKDYDDAIRQMNELENAKTPAAWKLNGGDLDEAIKHGGRFSYRASSDTAGVTRQAAQMFLLKQPINEPVVVSGWSKAENVVSKSGTPNDYSIYVDALLADGSYTFGQCATFRQGTHDWEKSEWVIEPKSPLVDLRVYAMFRNHSGTAWFDDIRIYRKSKPQENLLGNGDFETLGERRDIQFVRDNSLTDPQGRYRVLVTDNWGSDVRPDIPLSLLRFVCNVDPDLRAPEGRPTPASRGQQYFDTLFEGNPGIDGCYIDGAGAWTCWYISHRPDHFKYASQPLTYDAKTFVVGQYGGFQMWKWLRFIQNRYHNWKGMAPKTILGNMGPTTDAWNSYTALDIIGIESSIFQDRALMGYHRFGGYHKPVMPMNFVNLHKLDDRATAEEFVLASAQWGEFPTTGRLVREGYESFGDVMHAYYPALMEMSPAGWEPQPLAEGVAAERYGSKDVLYYSLRAPHLGRKATLTVLKEALAGVKNPVVMDAVQLSPVDAQMTAKGLAVPLQDGADELTILRVSSADNARQWLLQRAAQHCDNASRVRGKSENTERLQALAKDLRALKPAAIGAAVARVRDEQAKVLAQPDDLERTSALTELLEAERALGEWLLQSGGASLTLRGERVAPVSQSANLTAAFKAGKSGASVLGNQVLPERNILRLSSVKLPDSLAPAGDLITVQRALPGAAQVRTFLQVPVPGGKPIIITRVSNVHFTPVVTAQVSRAIDRPTKSYVYTVKVERLAAATTLVVRAESKGVQPQPAQVELKPSESAAQFRLSMEGAGTEVFNVRFTVCGTDGKPLAEASSEFRNLPVPPENDLALASKGATVKSDSSYSEYSPEVTIDGVWETSNLHWTKRAWASQDAAFKDGHWLEITLPKPTAVSQMWIYWAIDDSRVFSSRNYDIEVWDGKAWQAVAQVRDNPLSTVSQHTWPSRVTEKVRIHQLKGGGPAVRPEIMWVSEVGLYNQGTLN
jgi:hypothetical protein